MRRTIRLVVLLQAARHMVTIPTMAVLAEFAKIAKEHGKKSILNGKNISCLRIFYFHFTQLFYRLNFRELQMKKKIISYVNEFWEPNIIVLIALFLLSLLCIDKETNFLQWFVTTVLFPFIISSSANFYTANKQNEKIKLFEKKDMDMISTCSEIVGFLKSSVNKKINEGDLKHLLSQTKKLQSSIIRKE